MIKFRYTLILLFVFINCAAQTNIDSLTFSRLRFRTNNINSIFSKQINTYNLNSKLIYGKNIGQGFVGVKENFNSTIIESNLRNVREEQHFSLFGDYKFSDAFLIGTFINSSLYSDDRKLGIYESTTTQSSLFSSIYLLPETKLTPYIGYSKNRQVGIVDEGIVYGMEGNFTLSHFDDLKLSSIFRIENEKINKRSNEINKIQVFIQNNFERQVSNLLTASYSKYRKDFYLEADTLSSIDYNIVNNIQSRTEENYQIQDNIFYNSLTNNLTFNAQGSVVWRNIERSTKYISQGTFRNQPLDNRIEELRLDLSGNLQYKTRKFNAVIKFGLNEKEERHLPNVAEVNLLDIYANQVQNIFHKNNTSTQAMLSGEFNFRLSSSDNFKLSLFHRKMVYNTPSELNFDDRDELLSIMRFRYKRILSPFLSMYFDLEGSFNHIVYIFSERSSNNNIKRILKLGSGTTYKNENIFNSTHLELKANYTVFDFENLIQSFPSYSFREINAKDTLEIGLSKRTNFRLNSYLKISEQGNFNWVQFSSKPARLIVNYLLEPMFNFYTSKILLGVGIRFFKLSTFLYRNNEKELQSNYESLGPVTSIKLEMYNNLSLNFFGLYEIIHNEQNFRNDVITLNIYVNWNI